MIEPDCGYLEPQVDNTFTYHTDLVISDGDLVGIPGSRDERVIAWINRFAKETGTTVVINTLRGPGGGLPAVTFQGDYDHIDALIRRLSSEAPA